MCKYVGVRAPTPKENLSPTERRLIIEKGLIFNPLSTQLDFTVPQFAAYLRRTIRSIPLSDRRVGDLASSRRARSKGF